MAATISRFASLVDGFIKGYYQDERFRPMVERTLTDGAHLNSASHRGWFTSAYFHHPDETVNEATQAGHTVRRRVAVEDPLWMTGPRLDDILASLHLTDVPLDMLRQVEDERRLLGATNHLLTTADRPA